MTFFFISKEFAFQRCGALLTILKGGCTEIVKRKAHTVDILEVNIWYSLYLDI